MKKMEIQMNQKMEIMKGIQVKMKIQQTKRLTMIENYDQYEILSYWE